MEAATPPPSPPPSRDYAAALRSVLKTVFVLAALAAAGYWSWGQPFMLKPRTLRELSRLPPPATLAMPVEGVEAARVDDGFGAPRGRDRTHAGLDIFAERGTPVLSATRGVVSSISETGLGGKQVWVLGPARERHYYAHLDGWTENLAVGDVLWPGDPLGIVGDTGNARGTPPHLHYGVYGAAGAYDPLPLLRAGASMEGASR
jgi:murein DD-endopeptidase MepM/ murein hydrolase activator NlpD